MSAWISIPPIPVDFSCMGPTPAELSTIAPIPAVDILAAEAPVNETIKASKEVIDGTLERKLKDPLPAPVLISNFSPSGKFTVVDALISTTSLHSRVPSTMVSLIMTHESRIAFSLSTTTSPVPVEFAVMARVPEVVMGEPDTLRKDGVVKATDVTVPVVGVAHNRSVPSEVKT